MIPRIGLVLFLLVIAAGCGPREYTTAGGVKVVDLVEGSGPEVRDGSVVQIHYVGALTDGKVFDSSKDKGNPLSFRVGAGQVIAGMEEGLLTMKKGGTRKLTIPPEMGYGKSGIWGVIPGDAVLVFTVELLSVEQSGE